MVTWPKDNQAARNAFYGDPGKGEIPPQMVPVVPPFAMYYGTSRVHAIMFHRKAAPALLAALNEIWDYCGRDQAKVDAAGVSKYAGAYNHRMVRGSTTKWSNHAYATAIDLNAAENGLYAKGNMPQFVVDAFCRQGWMWGGWYRGRKDPMHFEAVDNGGRRPNSPPPLFVATAHLFDEPATPDQCEECSETDHGFADDREPEGAPSSPPKPSKIGVTQLATGATAGVVGAAQAASSVVGQINDVGTQVSTVTSQAGAVIEQSKAVVAIPKPGFWFGLLHVLTSPVFVSCVCLMIVTACLLTWFWHSQHRKAVA